MKNKRKEETFRYKINDTVDFTTKDFMDNSGVIMLISNTLVVKDTKSIIHELPISNVIPTKETALRINKDRVNYVKRGTIKPIFRQLEDGCIANIINTGYFVLVRFEDNKFKLRNGFKNKILKQKDWVIINKLIEEDKLVLKCVLTKSEVDCDIHPRLGINKKLQTELEHIKDTNYTYNKTRERIRLSKRIK